MACSECRKFAFILFCDGKAHIDAALILFSMVVVCLNVVFVTCFLRVCAAISGGFCDCCSEVGRVITAVACFAESAQIQFVVLAPPLWLQKCAGEGNAAHMCRQGPKD